MSQSSHSATDSRFVEAVRAIAHPLDGTARDYDLLMDLVGNARLVLLEAAMGAGPIRIRGRNARGRTDRAHSRRGKREGAVDVSIRGMNSLGDCCLRARL